MIPIICSTHFQHWLEALEKDPNEIRQELAETARKMLVFRVNEKCLTRRYTTLLELEQHLRKENGKLKDDFRHMEAVVTERIGFLQRFKVSGNTHTDEKETYEWWDLLEPDWYGFFSGRCWYLVLEKFKKNIV